MKSFGLYFLAEEMSGKKAGIFMGIAGQYDNFINYINSLKPKVGHNCFALLQCICASMQAWHNLARIDFSQVYLIKYSIFLNSI